LARENEARRPIWAKWRVGDDDDVHVVATYAEGEGFVQKEQAFESLERATASLGASFGEVVTRALAAGSRVGRWRP
jgi:hypothetical protein